MKSTRKKKFLAATAVIVFATAVIFLRGEKRERPILTPKRTAAKRAPGIEQEVYSFKVEGFNKDRKVEWELEGESADIILDKIKIKNLKAMYYGGDISVTIVADRAVYDKKTHNVELLDNIVGRTSDGGEFLTDYANWNAETEEITTDRYVVVKRENVTLRGKGLVTRPRLKWVRFETEVEVDMAPGKKILCNGPFEFDHEKNIAVFNNNVHIVEKENDTFTDRLTVYLDPETNEIMRVITEGNVRVVHRGDIEDMGKVSF